MLCPCSGPSRRFGAAGGGMPCPSITDLIPFHRLGNRLRNRVFAEPQDRLDH